MKYLLFNDDKQIDFYPLTLTRPVFYLRCGHFTIIEKWKNYLQDSVYQYVSGFLKEKFHTAAMLDEAVCWINGRFFPNEILFQEIQTLPKEKRLITPEGETIAWKGISPEKNWVEVKNAVDNFPTQIFFGETTRLNHITDIFRLNKTALINDYQWLTKNKPSQQTINDPYTKIYSPENIWLGENVIIRAATLNASLGPIILDDNVEIQEGAIIAGAHSVGKNAVINMGAKLRGDSTIGPYCKVGGEIANSVFLAYSNKAHDGFIGNSLIGEWCNLGADTNNSNLKNNYETIKQYSYRTKRLESTGLQFCGLTVGDHSKSGINTMFNTGTVVGVSANIFGGGFPPTFIPSFSWGGSETLAQYRFEKAIEAANKMMQRRNQMLSVSDINILKTIFEAEQKTALS
ncbi:MAG: glucose-1-phosphate thymidylyltransferase [Bacteroidia bacterium]|nr:glucose-1-phosphate thymidylyltransferase [Bacteroidia bacterium]